jgi:hypothetical protein
MTTKLLYLFVAISALLAARNIWLTRKATAAYLALKARQQGPANNA